MEHLSSPERGEKKRGICQHRTLEPDQKKIQRQRQNKDIFRHTKVERIRHIYLFLKDLIFYLFEREREHEQSRGVEVDREDQAPCEVESLTQGSIPGLWDHDMS